MSKLQAFAAKEWSVKKMITFEEAKQIAFSAAGTKGLDCCSEYKKAWYFFNGSEQWDGEPGVVIMKDDGRKRTLFQFLSECAPEEEPKRLNMDGAEIADDGAGKPHLPGLRGDGVFVMDDGWSEQIKKALEGGE